MLSGLLTLLTLSGGGASFSFAWAPVATIAVDADLLSSVSEGAGVKFRDSKRLFLLKRPGFLVLLAFGLINLLDCDYPGVMEPYC